MTDCNDALHELYAPGGEGAAAVPIVLGRPPLQTPAVSRRPLGAVGQPAPGVGREAPGVGTPGWGLLAGGALGSRDACVAFGEAASDRRPARGVCSAKS